MTRQHIKVLAQEISRIEDMDARYAAFKAVARACAYFNPSFDSNKFWRACNLMEAA